MCFINFNIVTTYSTTTGVVVSTSESSVSILIEDDFCCNEGVETSEPSLLDFCASMPTSQENEVLSLEGSMCNRMFDQVTRFFLSTGAEAVGSPTTVSNTEPTSLDDCCQSGSDNNQAELLEACMMETTEENVVFTFDSNDMTCVRRFNTVITTTLPVAGTVVGTPISTPGNEQQPNGDMCCQSGIDSSNDDLIAACGMTTTVSTSTFEWNENVCTESFTRTVQRELSDKTPIGSPVVTNAMNTVAQDDCCSNAGEDAGLLMACMTKTTTENVAYTYNSDLESCTRTFDTVVSNTL